MCGHKSTNWRAIAALLLIWMISDGLTAQDSVGRRTAFPNYRTDGTVLLVDDSPVFVRAIQHNGEPFPFLKSLGFNTVQLLAPPSKQQLKQASDSGLWLICPPPISIEQQPVSSAYRPVLAWSVGEGLTAEHQQSIQRIANEIRASDPADRPIVANVDSTSSGLSRLLDGIVANMGAINRDIQLQRSSDQLRRWADQSGKPIFSDIETEVPIGLTEQAIQFLGRDSLLPIEHQQLKYQLYEAITGGARGIRLRSRSRLDSQDPVARWRVTAISWLLSHCQQIEPWISGGLVERVNENNAQGIEVFRIRIAGSQLLLIQRPSGNEQWVCGNQSPATVSVFTNSAKGERLYQIDEAGAHLLSDFNQDARGFANLNECSYAACLLSTQDPQAVATIEQSAAEPINQLKGRFQLTEQSLSYFQLLEQQLAGTGIAFPIFGAANRQAEQAIAEGRRLANSGDLWASVKSLERADFEMARAKFEVLQRIVQSGSRKFSSPLTHHVGLLADHLNLQTKLSDAQWSANALPAGDFENLEQMIGAGWVNQKQDSASVTTDVQLSPAATVGGKLGLMLQAESISSGGGSLSPPPLWIRSAEVPVQRGQMVRVHGYVRVNNQSAQLPVIRITDSLGGEDLAMQFLPNDQWQEFVTYRVASDDTKFSVTFSVVSSGIAQIDEVTVRTLDQATWATQAKLETQQTRSP